MRMAAIIALMVAHANRETPASNTARRVATYVDDAIMDSLSGRHSKAWAALRGWSCTNLVDAPCANLVHRPW